MCSAPAATCWRMSASTTSGCTTRKLPLIHRHHGAMAAQMFAASAGFGIAGPFSQRPDLQARVLFRWRQTRPKRDAELQPIQRDQRFGLNATSGAARRSSSETSPGSNSPPRMVAAPRCPADRIRSMAHRARSSRYARRDSVREPSRLLWPLAASQCASAGRRPPDRLHAHGRRPAIPRTGPAQSDLVAALGQPSRGRCQAKRLVAKLVSGDEEDLHGRRIYYRRNDR